MSRSNYILPLALAAIVALFLYALIQIMLLRYQRGDLYPAYSTFRSDPLGTRAYYESLDATGLYQVSRGFVSLHRELSFHPDTLFFLGFAPQDFHSLSQDEVSELSDYVGQGGRVVIAMPPAGAENPAAPEKKKDDGQKASKAATPEPAEGKSSAPKTEQEKFERDEFRKAQEKEDEPKKRGEFSQKFEPSLEAVWGFGWSAESPHGKGKDDSSDADAQDTSSNKGDVLAVRANEGALEPQVPWKSAGYFLRIDPAWKIQYRAHDRPVLIERSWGKGRILISSDSYFLSNEALRDDRKPNLLSHVTGTGRHLLFDEVHLGTEEKEGVVVLARRFHLEGYLFGMLIVTALFLWRNSVPLVPPRAAADPNLVGGAVSGKDSRNGLVNLLRRNIPPRELLQVCLAEWKRTAEPGRSSVNGKAAAMDDVLRSTDASRDESIIQAYRQLREINMGSRHKESYANRN